MLSSRIVPIILNAFFCLSLFSADLEKPERVYRLCYTQKTQEWYEQQASLWEKEVQNNPQNERAWYYYFFATRYKTLGIDSQRRERLQNQIIDRMGASIPDSYLYYYIRFYHGVGDFNDLKKAYWINPNDPDLYWEFMRYYDDEADWDNRKKFCSKLYKSKDIASGLLEYNYNVLTSTDSNAILLTNGDNDTYPVWVLQDAKDVRKDVLVLNAHHIFVDRQYLYVRLKEKNIIVNPNTFSDKNVDSFLKDFTKTISERNPEVPIFVALTVYEDYIQSIKDNLYLVGLAHQYSENPIDSISILKNNIENNFRLDYLDYNWYDDLHVSHNDLNRFNTNYVDLFLEIQNNYFNNGDIETAKRWKNKSLFLAEKAGNKALITKINSICW
ncbi:hypothetical protein ACFLSX_04700 [Calditrichota bacterium]